MDTVAVRHVMEYIENAAQKYPEHIAFRDDNSEITYRELLWRAEKIGYHISQMISGIRQPVVVLMEKCVECLTAFFGIASSGNFYVCIDTEMAQERIRKILDNLHPAAIIRKGGNEAGKIITYDKCQMLDYEECFSTDTDEAEIAGRLQAIRGKMIDMDPLYVLYTSGSTGVPKGSIISHRSVIAYAEWASRTFHFDESAVFGSQTPFYFSMSVMDIFSTVRNAALLQIIPKKLFSFPIKLLEYLNEKNVNTIYWVPSALSIVADWKALDYVEVPGLRTILFAGEVMPAKQLNIWRSHLPDAVYANLFGPTEITDIGLYYILDREFQNGEPVPIGRPCGNMDAFAVTEEGNQAGKGETGELYFRGAFVGCGYYNDVEQTREAFVQNPLHSSYPDIVYRTGDLVKINEYNEYVYVGRRDFQIKHRGCRVELGEIESAAGACEKLDQAVCIFDPVRDHIILLFQGAAEKEDIVMFLKELLPWYMIPDEIYRIRAMPLNPNGKIDRRLLQDTYLEGKS